MDKPRDSRSPATPAHIRPEPTPLLAARQKCSERCTSLTDDHQQEIYGIGHAFDSRTVFHRQAFRGQAPEAERGLPAWLLAQAPESAWMSFGSPLFQADAVIKRELYAEDAPGRLASVVAPVAMAVGPVTVIVASISIRVMVTLIVVDEVDRAFRHDRRHCRRHYRSGRGLWHHPVQHSGQSQS